jgi:hypothetical protein
MHDLEDFFYEHAGWSYQPPNETSEQGKRRCAKELSEAFNEFRNENTYVSWHIDEIDSSDFDSDSEPRPLYCATLYYGTKIVGSLGGIDISDSSDPYAKVIEAEMWQEFTHDREKNMIRGDI